ncbi:MAG: response regulator [Bacteroidia bacterium]|nr:response regulator [Bacteroidia bacterium]
MSATVDRKDVFFYPDPKRIIARFFFPGPETRVQSIVQKVIDMPEQAAHLVLNQTLRDFSSRHRNISRIFQRHFDRVRDIMAGRNGDMNSLPEIKRLLIGAYFTNEYSIESAAFFNPSMVEHPDQTGLQEEQKRIIISFRATGEGHISSLVFRTGVLDQDNNFKMQLPGNLVDRAEAIRNFVYQKETFCQKLSEMHTEKSILKKVMDKLRFEFDYNELTQAVEETIREVNPDFVQKKMLQTITWLADSHYEISFSLDTTISERVIFPLAAAESNGIEDARFVKFTDDDGSVKYYATYTAFNGYSIMPKLIETKDFYNFTFMPIHGEIAQNKGMALFPRKIDGKYAMLSRLDGVNNYIMFSDDINLWQEAMMLQEPKFPWEFIQIGNCGSPIETEYGWLVITHGVGTMRKYCLGATLLDLEDPTKIIGLLSEPLISPNEEEREGYVPNVVYSCGSLIHNDMLIIPYAMSDTSSTYAAVPLDDLFSRLIPLDFLKEKGEAAAKARILVVEDEALNQKIIAGMLKSANYEVEIAPDGIVALMQIAKGKFDLILSDISMPNFDGYQLLDYVKQNNIDIPIAFMTSFTSKQEEVKGLQMGAVEYIKKPIDKELLLLKLEKIFTLRK